MEENKTNKESEIILDDDFAIFLVFIACFKDLIVKEEGIEQNE